MLPVIKSRLYLPLARASVVHGWTGKGGMSMWNVDNYMPYICASLLALTFVLNVDNIVYFRG